MEETEPSRLLKLRIAVELDVGPVPEIVEVSAAAESAAETWSVMVLAERSPDQP
jgi:hypothetical protein